MEKEFVTYPIALSLKELGFDEPCIAYWRNGIDDIKPTLLSEFVLDNSRTVYYTQCNGIEISAPLYQQVIDWFREKYKLMISINHTIGIQSKGIGSLEWHYTILDFIYGYTASPEYETFEEAREKAILKAIELCGNMKKLN